MPGRYLIRLDDIAPTMAWDRFERLSKLFDEHDIKPLLGVIPDNQDPEFLPFAPCPGDFWSEVASWQSRGWEIAQHGYQHVYVTRDCGLLGVNGLSEFAGLPYEVQLDKLARGQSIFRQHGVRCETFMAPSHSFDRLTLRALKELGFTTVTDGFDPWPSIEEGLIFIPQWFANPRVLPIGVQTFCLHINGMTDTEIRRVEEFVEQHTDEFITVAEARQLATSGRLNRLAGRVIEHSLKAWRRRRLPTSDCRKVLRSLTQCKEPGF